MTLKSMFDVDEPAGIFVSGGTDSALLLYMLLKNCKSKIHIFTITNSKKYNYNVKAALDVINKCIEITENDNVEHHIFHRILQQDNDFYNIINLYRQRNLIKKVFIGITANPPDIVLTDFPDDQSDRDKELRNPNVFRDEIQTVNDFVLPWTNINKKEIFNLYKEFDLLDTLYPLTRSCESTKDYGFIHCGECWWCKERKWAFGKL